MNASDNAASYFVDRHAAGPLAEKTAFREAGGRSLTYAALASEAAKMAGLFAAHGIKR